MISVTGPDWTATVRVSRIAELLASERRLWRERRKTWQFPRSISGEQDIIPLPDHAILETRVAAFPNHGVPNYYF
jgi:hypothetical protein